MALGERVECERGGGGWEEVDGEKNILAVTTNQLGEVEKQPRHPPVALPSTAIRE